MCYCWCDSFCCTLQHVPDNPSGPEAFVTSIVFNKQKMSSSTQRTSSDIGDEGFVDISDEEY